MKTIMLLILIAFELSAHTITNEETDNGTHYSITGYCSNNNRIFTANWTPDLHDIQVCGSNFCVKGKTKNEGINKFCNKKISNNRVYAFIKKDAIIFSQKKGEYGIEKALSWNLENDHSKGNKMWTMELATIYGKLAKNGKRQKIRLYKKYTKRNLSSSYWKIKDGTKTRYISEEHLDF